MRRGGESGGRGGPGKRKGESNAHVYASAAAVVGAVA